MAAGPLTQVGDVIVPRIFTPQVQQLTTEKSRLIQSGALVADAALDELLAGGGKTFDIPSYQDLDNDADRVSTDTPHAEFTGGVAEPDPRKIETAQEVAVRLSRNNSWSSSDLAAALSGMDPMAAIANRVAAYWSRRLQAAFVATMKGVFLDNDANDSSDYTHDVKGASYVAGVTDFSTSAFLDATLTMGDSMEDLALIFVHSVVFNRMQKNNLIDFIPDARGETQIPTFLGRQVVVDDGMPVTSQVYESWLFGRGAVRFGQGTPKVPTAVERKEGAGNGGGQEILYNRVEWVVHPAGHAYTGTAPSGGPGNSTGANDLANAGSWNRVFSERKQVRVARLITREA